MCLAWAPASKAQHLVPLRARAEHPLRSACARSDEGRCGRASKPSGAIADARWPVEAPARRRGPKPGGRGVWGTGQLREFGGGCRRVAEAAHGLQGILSFNKMQGILLIATMFLLCFLSRRHRNYPSAQVKLYRAFRGWRWVIPLARSLTIRGVVSAYSKGGNMEYWLGPVVREQRGGVSCVSRTIIVSASFILALPSGGQGNDEVDAGAPALSCLRTITDKRTW